MKTFRNTKFTKRNYDCTNVAACQAMSAPGPEWKECDEDAIAKMSKLYVQAGVYYYGWM